MKTPPWLLLLGLLGVAGTAHADEPVRLIFDTDMMGDVDDVGTVAVLHTLANQGEVRILAMGLSGKNPWSPLCLGALNAYFRRPDVPIGVVKGPAFHKKSRYAETIAKEFPYKLKSADGAPDAAVLYRKVLAGQPDKSVVMVSVGQVSGPDPKKHIVTLSFDDGWLIFNTHGLDGEGWGPIRATYLDRLLERLVAMESVVVLPVGMALTRYAAK